MPGSEFLTRLFYDSGDLHRLPAGTAHYLVFAAESGATTDGRISVKSQLRQEALEDAAGVYGIRQSHTGVLHDPQASALVNRLLAQAIRASRVAVEARAASVGSAPTEW